MTSTDRPCWRTSSYSSNGESCVELAPTSSCVLLRHSKHPDAGTISFTRASWATFVHEARNDLPSANTAATIAHVGSDMLVTALTEDVELRFDADEWAAFIAGATDGEFDFVEIDSPQRAG